MEIFWQDFRYGLRVFRKNPAFTIVAILTLAIGIGANTAIFSVTNALFASPLPVRNPEEVVRILNQAEGGGSDTFSFPFFREMRDRLQRLEVIAHKNTPVSFGTGKEASTIRAELVSGNYFQVFAVQPIAGRTFSEADDRTVGAHPVAVISHRLWENSFQQNAAVIGQSIYLNGHLFTIVGVLPEEFPGSYLTSDTDVWTTISMHEQIRPKGLPLERAGWGWLNLTARLHSGVSIQEAETEIAAVANHLEKDFPQLTDGVTVKIIPATALPESLSGSLARALRFLSIVAALALLVVCANLAGALLSHAFARSRETAIRHSLGASRSRLLRQWMTEIILLALWGGMAGLLFALWVKEGLKLWLPGEWQPIISTLNLDFRVLLFAFFISLITGILCGLIPALQMRNPDLNASIKKSSASGAQRHRLFGTFVAVQTSISLLLLIIAALLLRSLLSSTQFEVGFNPKNLLVATVDTQRQGFTEDQGREFFLNAAERLKSLPQVLSLSYATVTPLGPDSESQGFEIPGHTTSDGKRIFSIDYNSVGTNYFRTMQIPLVQGRDFTDQDVQGATSPVAIINQTMAKMFWQEKNPVGQKIRLADGPELEIIGVARNVQYYSIGEEPRPYVYLTPNAVYVGQMTFQIRTTLEPDTIGQTVIREIAAVDPKLAAYNVMPYSRLRKIQMFPLRALTTISILLGLLTLVLTSVGIYGVLSYAVFQRTKEIGVRMALGATRKMILVQTLRQGLMFVLIGSATGIIASLFVTRFLSSILFRISPTDEISFIAVTILISAVATIAALIPARRAMKIEPTIALRYE